MVTIHQQNGTTVDICRQCVWCIMHNNIQISWCSRTVQELQLINAKASNYNAIFFTSSVFLFIITFYFKLWKCQLKQPNNSSNHKMSRSDSAFLLSWFSTSLPLNIILHCHITTAVCFTYFCVTASQKVLLCTIYKGKMVERHAPFGRYLPMCTGIYSHILVNFLWTDMLWRIKYMKFVKEIQQKM